MEEPGGLRDLGEKGGEAWNDLVQSCLGALVTQRVRPGCLQAASDLHDAKLTGPDWGGLPARVVSCLGRARALRVLDHERRLQEEYLEWRVVRDRRGKIQRVELTTELREYWELLAAFQPQRTVEVAAELIGRPVSLEELYGGPIPEAPEARRGAFVRNMIERQSPLNDGREGILFMCHPQNRLDALLEIAVAAACRCVLSDPLTGRERCGTAKEVIPLLERAAVAGRASDPVLVERLGRLAFEGRPVALAEPLGIYIQGFEYTRLRTPRGEPVPAEWLRTSRGLSAEDAADGWPRSQRAVFEVPAGLGFVVGDLIDTATEQPIDHGGQIAELLQLRVLLLVGAGSASPAELAHDPNRPPADPCRDIMRLVDGEAPV